MIIDDKLMKYVVFKKRTEEEVRQKCKRLEYTEDYIDEIIEYLTENEYINDKIYVEKYINSLMKLKKASIYEIKIDLLRRGVNEKYIEDYIGNNQEILIDFELESARKIVAKKLQLGEDVEKIKKHLMGKRYSYSTISEAIDNLDNLTDN